MPRVKNPLPDFTDRELQLEAARRFDVEANLYNAGPLSISRGLAARLRQIARRVPLWTDSQEISR